MISETVLNEILNDMVNDLTSEQLMKLKSSIIMHTCEKTDTTEVIVPNEINDRYINMYMITMNVEGKSESTIKQYIRAIHKFLDYFNVDFRVITYEHAMMYMSSIVKSGVSGSTVDNTRKFIKGFFTWALDNDYIVKNPFAKIKKISRNPLKKETLNEDDIVELRDRCHGDVRDLALVDFLLATGIRVSECARLNISDVDFRNGQVNIYGKKTKTWRTVYLDANARKHLKEYIDSRKDKNKALFVSKYGIPNRLCGGSINILLHKLEKSCTLTVHVFRKTLATRLYSKGMSIEYIANILGHTTSTCVKYYVNILKNNIKSEYIKYA